MTAVIVHSKNCCTVLPCLHFYNKKKVTDDVGRIGGPCIEIKKEVKPNFQTIFFESSNKDLKNLSHQTE